MSNVVLKRCGRMTALVELAKIAGIFVAVFLMVYGMPLLFALLIKGLPHG